MRMGYPGYTDKDEQKVRNRLQQRMARFREKFVMVSWRDTAGDNNAIKDRVLDKLNPAQLAARGGLGSTRGSTPGSRDSQGRVIPVPGRRLPGRRPPKTANIGKTATHSSPSSRALPNRQRNVDIDPTMGGAQQPYASTSHAASTGPQRYKESSPLSPSPEVTIPIMGERRVSSYADTQPQQGRRPTVYAGNHSPQHPGNLLYASPLETLRGPNQLLSDEEDWDSKESGSDESDHGDDEQGDGESSDDDDDGSDWNEEADADMLMIEETPRAKSLIPKECCEFEKYLKEDRMRTQMYPGGMISVDELMLDTQKNEEELKQGLKRTRGETSDDDEVEGLQGWRAKRNRKEEGATGSSSQPFSEFQEPTCKGFDDEQPGYSGEYLRQGALAKTSRRPTTRPVGSAVQRLHNDRLRRPPPKATVGQKDIYESLNFHQPHPVLDGEWTVFHSHIDPQPTPYPPQQAGVEEGLYTNIGQRQGRLSPYESRQDNTMETRNPDTNAGQRQLRPSSHHQRQPDGPPDDDNSSDAGSSADHAEPAHHDAPHRAHQYPAARTIQDDPFFPDELFNGMLNGQPQTNHVGSIYTRSQQQEIDEYYHRLMAPRPRPEAQKNAREGPMPPRPRPRTQQPRTAFAADVQNPHRRPQARQGGGVPRQHTPHNVPIGRAQSGNAPPVAQVTQDESDQAMDTTTLWNPEWCAFVHHHDADPLLRAHYPDEYHPGSPPGTPQS